MNDYMNLRITQEQYQQYTLEEKIRYSEAVIEYFKNEKQTLLIKEFLKQYREELGRLNQLK